MTLTEVTVVFVLATIVMTGIVGFYLNSQAVWVDGSTQAIAQREASMVLDAVSSRARRASTVYVDPTDSLHSRIDLSMPGQSAHPESTYSYWWDAGDSLIHEGYRNASPPVDRGPMLSSRVQCFACRANNAAGLLSIDSLRLRTADGAVVTMGTVAALQNRGGH